MLVIKLNIKYVMGRGDKKTRKGKISQGSYGITRKRKSSTTYVAPTAKKAAAKTEEADAKPKKAAAKKAPAKKAAEKK